MKNLDHNFVDDTPPSEGSLDLAYGDPNEIDLSFDSSISVEAKDTEDDVQFKEDMCKLKKGMDALTVTASTKDDVQELSATYKDMSISDVSLNIPNPIEAGSIAPVVVPEPEVLVVPSQLGQSSIHFNKQFLIDIAMTNRNRMVTESSGYHSDLIGPKKPDKREELGLPPKVDHQAYVATRVLRLSGLAESISKRHIKIALSKYGQIKSITIRKKEKEALVTMRKRKAAHNIKIEFGNSNPNDVLKIRDKNVSVTYHLSHGISSYIDILTWDQQTGVATMKWTALTDGKIKPEDVAKLCKEGHLDVGSMPKHPQKTKDGILVIEYKKNGKCGVFKQSANDVAIVDVTSSEDSPDSDMLSSDTERKKKRNRKRHHSTDSDRSSDKRPSRRARRHSRSYSRSRRDSRGRHRSRSRSYRHYSRRHYSRRCSPSHDRRRRSRSHRRRSRSRSTRGYGRDNRGYGRDRRDDSPRKYRDNRTEGSGSSSQPANIHILPVFYPPPFFMPPLPPAPPGFRYDQMAHGPPVQNNNNNAILNAVRDLPFIQELGDGQRYPYTGYSMENLRIEEVGQARHWDNNVRPFGNNAGGESSSTVQNQVQRMPQTDHNEDSPPRRFLY